MTNKTLDIHNQLLIVSKIEMRRNMLSFCFGMEVSVISVIRMSRLCLLWNDPSAVWRERRPGQGVLYCRAVTYHQCSLPPLAEAELLDCEGKSDSSPEREPAEDDSKGADGGKKRKRKPYRPGRAPD